MNKRLIAWAASVAAGLAIMGRYQATPGSEVDAPIQWPRGLPFERHPTKFTLVMFAHPLCPCTRASIGELARLMAQANERAVAHVLFVHSGTALSGWEASENCRSAAVVPGVRVRGDPEGASAHAFGAGTSGHVLLYDSRGTLAFEGGITPSRGHSGDNAGASAIVAVLNGDVPGCATTPIFGCPLLRI